MKVHMDILRDTRIHSPENPDALLEDEDGFLLRVTATYDNAGYAAEIRDAVRNGEYKNLADWFAHADSLERNLFDLFATVD